LLDESGGNVESDTAEITTRHGVSERTVQSAKTWLKKNGLIFFSPDKDENGKVRPHGGTQCAEETEPDVEI
jgi:hypothetical protein